MKTEAKINYVVFSGAMLLLAIVAQSKNESFDIKPEKALILGFFLAILGFLIGNLREKFSCSRSDRLEEALENLDGGLEDPDDYTAQGSLIIKFGIVSGIQGLLLFSIPITAAYLSTAMLYQRTEEYINFSGLTLTDAVVEPVPATLIGIVIGYITLLVVNRLINAVSNRCCPSYVASGDQAHLGELRRLRNLAAAREVNENAEGEAPGYGAMLAMAQE